jgi:predicted metal-binding membrane protein
VSAESRPIERLVGRDNWIVAACLIAIAGLAWWWLARPVGMSMAPPLSADYLSATFAMWALMMVAMMLPSASPMILIYARVARHNFGASAGPGIAVFALSYLLVWSAFSLAAAIAQAVLVQSGVVDAMRLEVGDVRLAGGLLIAAGLYQLTPLKAACLENCRSPLAFLGRGIRPGAAGALRLGIGHGLYCLGCCWVLMLLLFVGGVMNLAWVAGLALIVAAEKLFPWRGVRLALAAVLLAAGASFLAGASIG